jgi:hypothetical protein
MAGHLIFFTFINCSDMISTSRSDEWLFYEPGYGSGLKVTGQWHRLFRQSRCNPVPEPDPFFTKDPEK